MFFKKLRKELEKNNYRGLVYTKIPRDPQKFYESFGFLDHPRLKDKDDQPLKVTKLAPYQYEFWKYEGNALVIKSQKIGLTTSRLLEDFQFTLLPEGAGKDVLIIAQNLQLARDHILTLKKMIRSSNNYSQYMIIGVNEELFFEEKTKACVIYIRNPYNPKKPSRIIGLGGSESSVLSWKNVGKIHMSDVAKLSYKDQKSFFSIVFSRLANTEGIIKIETPPVGQQGEVFNIYNKTRQKLAKQNEYDIPKFKIFMFTAKDAVASGIISQKFLEQERMELGELVFSQLYECVFLPPHNQWYKEEWFHTESYAVEW